MLCGTLLVAALIAEGAAGPGSSEANVKRSTLKVTRDNDPRQAKNWQRKNGASVIVGPDAGSATRPPAKNAWPSSICQPSRLGTPKTTSGTRLINDMAMATWAGTPKIAQIAIRPPSCAPRAPGMAKAARAGIACVRLSITSASG